MIYALDIHQHCLSRNQKSCVWIKTFKIVPETTTYYTKYQMSFIHGMEWAICQNILSQLATVQAHSVVSRRNTWLNTEFQWFYPKVEAKDSSEKLITTYQNTEFHNLEDHNQNLHHPEEEFFFSEWFKEAQCSTNSLKWKKYETKFFFLFFYFIYSFAPLNLYYCTLVFTVPFQNQRYFLTRTDFHFTEVLLAIMYN